MATIFHADCLLVYFLVQCCVFILLQMTVPTQALPVRPRVASSNAIDLPPEAAFLLADDTSAPSLPHLIRRMRSLREDALSSILDDMITHRELAKGRGGHRQRKREPRGHSVSPTSGRVRVAKGGWERSGWGGGYGR